MDLNVPISLYLILALSKKTLALVAYKWACAAQIAPPIIYHLVPKWFPLRTNDPNHPHVVTEWSSISQYLVPKWSPSNHKIVPM